MPNLNRVQIIGHLGRDPEIRHTQAGDPVANFPVAVSEKYNGQERVEWFACVAFKRTADVVQKYLHKGDPVYVEGKLQTREYQGRDGEKRKSMELIASNIVLLGSKRQEPRADASDAFDNPGDDPIPF